jgi:1-acyl-sn-glycerol-3-phosphate acyltransferase
MVASGLFLSLWGHLVLRFAPQHIVSVPKTWARVCLFALRVFCGIKVNVQGKEFIPQGGAIIAAQHQSALDILIWLAVLPNPALVFKQELDKIPFFGSLLRPSGMIAVDRDGGANALRKMIAECRASLANGRQVLIFPEGTRVVYGVRVPLHTGIVAIAKGASAPVIPAATDSGRRWAPRAFLKTPGPVGVKIYPPLPPGLRREDVIARITSIFYEEGVK